MADDTIDLQTLPVQNDNRYTPGSPSGISPAGHVEHTRRRISYALLLVLGSVVIYYYLIGVFGVSFCELKGFYTPQKELKVYQICKPTVTGFKVITDTMNPVFTGIIGLVGSVVGFYFGSESKK